MYFPHMLLDSPLLTIYKRCNNKSKPSELYNFLNETFEQDHTVLEQDLVLYPIKKQDLLLNSEYKFNKQLRNWLHWVNLNIILKLGIDTYITTDVKVRIAINMVDKFCTSKDNKLLIITNLQANLAKERSEIRVEDLPF